MKLVHKLTKEEKVLSISTIGQYGIANAITKKCFGNKIGFKFRKKNAYLYPQYGSFIIELKEEVKIKKLEILGTTIEQKK